jgi:hypothetical protein
MLTENGIRVAARLLLNESAEGFWLNTDFSTYCSVAAIDISSRTLCYEVTTTLSLATGTQFYPISQEYIRMMGVVNTTTGKALKRALPQMEGFQTAQKDGEPLYFYDFASQLGVFPIPPVAHNGNTVRLFMAATTNLITNIPDRFTLPATLMVVAQAKIKERQFGQAAQFLNLYNVLLGGDRSDVLNGKLRVPPDDNYAIPSKTVVTAGQ